MNLKESPRRLWALVGAGGSLLIIAVSYLLLISGQKSTQHDLNAQAQSARELAAVSKNKLSGLQQDNKKLPQYKAQLLKLERALPKSSATAQFGADVHRIAAQSGVTITSINASPPVAGQGSDPTAVAGATALPITVAATGPTERLEKFLDLLQTAGPRAVLVGSVSETVPNAPGSNSAPTLNISLKAFYGNS